VNGQPLTLERFEAFLNDLKNARVVCDRHVVSPVAMRERHHDAVCCNCYALVDLRGKWVDLPPLPPVVDLDTCAPTQETS